MLQDEIDEALEEAQFQIGFYETGLNGSVISWKYWVQQMPILSAGQAARLMAALDPDLYVNLNKHHGNIDPTDAILKATKIQQLAETSGKLKASPAEWLTWAQSLGLSVHDGFRLEVLELPVQQTEDKPKLNEKSQSSGKIVNDMFNRNSLDPAIDAAIKLAGNMARADVFLHLKELALAGHMPFTGVIAGKKLCYTNDNDEPDLFSKDALGKRLKIRRDNASQSHSKPL